MNEPDMNDRFPTTAGSPHTFRITVTLLPAGSDCEIEMAPQVAEAFSVQAALVIAAQRPLTAFLPDTMGVDQ